jgi:peptidoglycan glycosyltransferase
MNKQLRRLGAGILGCYLALFAMVNYVQVFRAPALNTDSRNTRQIVRDFDRPRGQIISADGVVLAKTDKSAPGDPFEFQRSYPGGDLFGHITGFLNFSFGAAGVEQTYNDELSGNAVSQEYQTLRDLFIAHDSTGDVTLTMRADVQQVARDALGERNGAVVAVDPRDGSVLAMWSFPSFDPNPLASHDGKAAQAAKSFFEADPNRPLRGKGWQERFFPGSTFKVVTGSTGVESGKVTPTEPSFPVATEYKPPDGKPISNFGGESCGGALLEILRISCNSSFAEMGAELLGPQIMQRGAAQFGFNERPPIDLPAAATSTFPDTGKSKALLGQASIGQFNTQASPLQMALVSAGIANNGVIMTPHVMKEIRDSTGGVLRTFEPKVWKNAVSPQSAATMRDAMVGVVEGGTGTAARIPGIVVGGKTGTAQIDTAGPDQGVLAWFTCFAGPSGATPTVAVTVLVENQKGFSDATGGAVAAPIAKTVLQKILDIQSQGG